MGKKARIKKLKLEEKNRKWEREVQKRAVIFRGKLLAKAYKLVDQYIDIYKEKPKEIRVPFEILNYADKKLGGIKMVAWDRERDKKYIEKEDIDIDYCVAILEEGDI